MHTLADDFLAWSEDPARTLEERYGILRLVESIHDHHYRAPGKPMKNFEADSMMREARRFNPAYQPVIDPAKLRIAAGLLPEVRELQLDHFGEERPLRDLGFLAFLPQLESLRLTGVETPRLEALRYLPSLRSFSIRTDEVDDFSDLAACRELRSIKVQTWHPWPILDGLETLPHLERFEWLGNGRSLIGIPALPKVKHFELDSSCHHEQLANCLRDFHQLPEMPELEYFLGGWFYRLDGIARYPRLHTLTVMGWFKSLAPLAGLPAVTHLRVLSSRLAEVATIASMPSVFQFHVRSVRPQDWSPLFDSTTLREVHQEECTAPQPDFETLQMLLDPADDHFAAPEPRPLPPLRLRVRHRHVPGVSDAGDPEFPAGPDGWDGRFAMRQSEIRWAESYLRSALEKAGLLKLKGVRLNRFSSARMTSFFSRASGHERRIATIHLLRTEAIGELPAIVECLRSALAGIRHPWQVHFTTTPEVDAEDWDESWRDELTPEEELQRELEEKREATRKRKRHEAYLQDEHRLHLLEELGADPAEFRPTPVGPEEPLPEITISQPGGKDQKKGRDAGPDDAGGLAEASPDDDEDADEHWLPPAEISDPNIDWASLRLMFTLTEEGIFMVDRRPDGVESLAYLLDLEPEYLDEPEEES